MYVCTTLVFLYYKIKLSYNIHHAITAHVIKNIIIIYYHACIFSPASILDLPADCLARNSTTSSVQGMRAPCWTADTQPTPESVSQQTMPQ